MILVYQMGKVASQSWIQAISAASPAAEPPIHVHHLAPPSRLRLATALELTPPRQTIANPLLPREQLRKGALALEKIERCRHSGEPIRIITGFRDPVARSISLLMFMADFYDHTSRVLSVRKGATADILVEALSDIWLSTFQPAEPECSFEWVIRDSVAMFRSWFADELATVFGVDILSTPFPCAGPQTLRGPGVDVLVYRVEDLAPTAPSHGELLTSAASFLGVPAITLSNVNTTATRRSYQLYRSLREQFRLSPPLIDAIYDNAIVRHFYSTDEIAAFKARWIEPGPTAT